MFGCGFCVFSFLLSRSRSRNNKWSQPAVLNSDGRVRVDAYRRGSYQPSREVPIKLAVSLSPSFQIGRFTSCSLSLFSFLWTACSDSSMINVIHPFSAKLQTPSLRLVWYFYNRKRLSLVFILYILLATFANSAAKLSNFALLLRS